MIHSRTADLRVVGAVLGLGLDAALLASASLLVIASLSAAWGLVLSGTIGLVVAPFIGWRYGPRAASRSHDTWPTEAFATVLLVAASLVAAMVFQAAVGPTDYGTAGLLSFLAYELLIGAIVSVVLTCLVAVPMGLVWTGLLRWVAVRLPEVARSPGELGS